MLEDLRRNNFIVEKRAENGQRVLHMQREAKEEIYKKISHISREHQYDVTTLDSLDFSRLDQDRLKREIAKVDNIKYPKAIYQPDSEPVEQGQ